MKSILIIGMGRFGRHLATKLTELGNEVLVVDRDSALINSVADKFADAQIGDCTNEAVIKALGVTEFDICFVSIGEDFQSSLVITSLLKAYNAKYVVAKANQDIQADLLRKIGADEIVYPEKEIAEKAAVKYNASNIIDYIQLTSDYSIYEIPVIPDWVGKSIVEIDVRRKYKINVVALIQNGVLTPANAESIFQADSHMVVMGKSSDVFRLASKIK